MIQQRLDALISLWHDQPAFVKAAAAGFAVALFQFLQELVRDHERMRARQSKLEEELHG